MQQLRNSAPRYRTLGEQVKRWTEIEIYSETPRTGNPVASDQN